MASYEYKLKNAYIGWEVWEPDATRTMLYLKFENNLIDSSWNNQSVSWAWIWYWTTGNKYYVERTGTASWTYINPPQTLMQSIWSWDFTVSLWVWCVEGSGAWIFTNEYDSSSPWYWLYIKWYTNSLDNSKINLWWANNWWGGPSDAASCYAEWLNRYTWHHMIVTRNSWIISLYVDWQNYWDVSMTRSFANPWVSKFKILNRNDYTSQAWAEAWVRMSEVILEKVWWATEKCVWYFNSTKSNYWF